MCIRDRYNASLNSFDRAKKVNFVNNFNAEWRPVETVMVRARVGVGKNVRKADKFLSPQHTSFDLSAKNQKGSYKMCIRDREKAVYRPASQIQDTGKGIRFRYYEGKFSCVSDLEKTQPLDSGYAVSYTHLDVYKRQAPTCSVM